MADYRNNFGVLATDLNLYINPANSPHSFVVGYLATGTCTISGFNVAVVNKNWGVNVWNDFKFYFNNKYYDIESNTANALVIGETTTVAGGTYLITTNSPISTTYADTLIYSAVSEIKSYMPEKYRRIVDGKIEGEILSRNVIHDQKILHLSTATTNTSNIRLYRNPLGNYATRTICNSMIGPQDNDGIGYTYSDYLVSGQTVTIQLGGDMTAGLSRGDIIAADYDHELPTVPPLLKQMTIDLTILKLSTQVEALRDVIPAPVLANAENTKELLKMLREEKIGIPELDKLDLYSETRTDNTGRKYGTVSVWRA